MAKARVRTKPPRSRRESELREQLQQFAGTIGKHRERYNIKARDAAEIVGTIDTYLKAYAVACKAVKGSRSQALVRDKNVARKAAESLHSIFYNSIKNDPGVTNGDKLAVGIKLNNPKRTKIRVPKRVPQVKAVMAQQGKHTLKFADVDTPVMKKGRIKAEAGSAKGKPPGAAFIQLYMAIGEGKTQPLEAARELGLFTKNPIIVEHTEPNNGRQAVYWARWISPTGEPGKWSKPTSMAIAA